MGTSFWYSLYEATASSTSLVKRSMYPGILFTHMSKRSLLPRFTHCSYILVMNW